MLPKWNKYLVAEIKISFINPTYGRHFTGLRFEDQDLSYKEGQFEGEGKVFKVHGLKGNWFNSIN